VLIQAIVSGGRRRWCTAPAETLGFAADAGIDEVVQAFIESDLQM
jgi:hypothetical protein